MFFVVLVVAIISSAFNFADCQSNRRVVCYLGSWANYREGRGKFVVEDIDPFLCTHIIYAFAKLGDDNRIASFDPWLDLNSGLGAYRRFNDLKNRNRQLKTLLAIGGWNEGSEKYSRMASSPATRKVFIDSCVNFLKEHKFDGLDVDWEYPANRGGVRQDKQNFVHLLRELKEAFTSQGLLLTAAVGAGKSTIDSAYDIPGISRHLDFINLMTYDFHGGWERFTGLNAPLYARSSQNGDQRTLNVDFAVNYWIRNGAPPNKLVLGMGTYGNSFTLQNPNHRGLGAPADRPGSPGPYTKQSGFMGYNEICEMMKPNGQGWTLVFDNEQQAPYIFKENQWIGFDNIQSIKIKVDYLKSKNLGGGMIWSLETDDFRNYCENGRYPLLSTIANGLRR